MRNNRPFLREPPYRRRETLIERLGFLFAQISRLSFLFPIGLAVSSGILIEDERTIVPTSKVQRLALSKRVRRRARIERW